MTAAPLEAGEAIAAMDQRNDLPQVAAPLLAIAGADDPATPPDLLGEIAGGVKDGRLLVVPEAAHLANAQQPQAITPAIVAHLKGEEVGSGDGHEHAFRSICQLSDMKSMSDY